MALTPYPGLYPLALGSVSSNGQFPTTPAAGTGLWPTPLEGQGGDARSQMDLFAGFEGLVTRTNFLGWRTIDIVDGGTYTFASTVSLGNAMIFNGACTVTLGLEFQSGATLFGDSGSFLTWGGTATFNGSVTLNAAVTFGGAGTTHVKNGAIFQFDPGSTFNAGSPIVHFGGTGCSVLREGPLPFPADTADHFDPSTLDYVIIDASTLTAPRIWTLDHPASGGCVTVVLMQAPGTNTTQDITVKDAGGATVTTISHTPDSPPVRLVFSPSALQWRLSP